MERDSGEVKNKTVLEDISQNLPEKEGFLEMSGIQNGNLVPFYEKSLTCWKGLFHSEEWRILEKNKNFMLGNAPQVIYSLSFLVW